MCEVPRNVRQYVPDLKGMMHDKVCIMFKTQVIYHINIKINIKVIIEICNTIYVIIEKCPLCLINYKSKYANNTTPLHNQGSAYLYYELY